MRIRGVVFDLFHTLTGLESERSALPSTSDVLGIDRRRWDALLQSSSQRRLTGQERDPFRIVAALAREVDVAIDDDRIARAVAVRIERFRQTLLQVPAENIQTLRRLRTAGYRLGLISNADAMEVAAWNDSQLEGLFDAAMFSCDVGCVKPQPLIYERCLTELGLRAAECLFVGDGGSDELIGARRVGMSPVFVSGVIAELWPDRIDQGLSNCDRHVRAVPEVLTLLGLERDVQHSSVVDPPA